MSVIPAPQNKWAQARWVSPTSTFMRNLVERAKADIGGVIEDPIGSNRGAEIDAYNIRAGVPVGSFWCASAVGAWWQDVGLEVPKGYASCDAWMRWGKSTGRWRTTPIVGAAVLYGQPGDATHIGLVIRTATPSGQSAILSIEGNTSIEGSEFQRNGYAVALKIVTTTDPVLGYVYPFAPGDGWMQ